MARLIDADELFNWSNHKLSDAVKYGNENPDQQQWSYSTVMMYEIADEINNAPTVDPTNDPENHGKWECVYDSGTVFGDVGDCSICGCHFATSKYCPNCGAKMDGGSGG